MAPMDKPNKPYPTSMPPTTLSPMPLNLPDPSIKGDSFDQLLQNRGIRIIHKRATLCPNLLALDTNAHNPDCPFCNDSNYIYYGDREIWGIFSGNSIEKTFEQHGVWEVGSAVMTFPTEYPDGTQADFNTFDRLVFPDFEVRLYELLEYEPTPDNTQSLRYPIISVDHMVATNVGTKFQERVFQPGVDFDIVDGDIVWVNGKQPVFDPVANRGQVISIVYYANPHYIVLQSLRELRITQEFDPASGQKIARRLPQEVLVRRDFMVSPGNARLGPD